MFRCPGQDQRFWKPEDIFEVSCPCCGKAVEFFKDEPQLKCHNCGQAVPNPKIDLGCAEWCEHAEQCLGLSVARESKILKHRLIEEMKKVFGNDSKRIKHALEVLGYAERIQGEEGGDPLVVRAAAILHDIGIIEAERKYGSPAGKYQEIEGPPIAKAILLKYHLDNDKIEHICRIIANHHSAAEIDTVEFRCIWDADHLVNIRDELSLLDKKKLSSLVERVFKTKKGKQIVSEAFIN